VACNTKAAARLPADICMPLLQLGYDSFADLLCRQRKPTLISTTDLCRVHGHRVKRGHKLALNRLTVLLNEQDLSKLTVEKAKAYSSVAAIDIALKTVNNPMFTELCSQEHPGLRAVRNQERSTLRLLQIHVRNRASHARTSSEEATHAGEADENNEMGEHTEQGKQKCGRMPMDTFCTACKSTQTAYGIHFMINMNRRD